MALAAGLISPEAVNVSRCNDKIDRATAALRADKASGPFGNREIGSVACGLFAGIDINYAPAAAARDVEIITDATRRHRQR